MVKPCRVLALEDRPEDAEIAERELRRGGRAFVLKRVESGEAFRSALEEWEPEVILCDFTLPGFDGLSALALAKGLRPDVPVIMFTGTVSEETAVLCLKAGADDYILKNNLTRLQPAVESALKAARDRREKRETEEALRESESRYRALVESAPDAIVTAGADGRIRLWNSAAEAVFGWPAQETLGQPISMLVPERHHGLTDQGLKRLMDQLGPGQRSHSQLTAATGRRKDGSEFPAEMSVSSSREKGEIVLTAVIRDVTERALAQKALESLSRQYELLLTSAGEGIVGLDPDGTVSYVNPVAASLLGMNHTELLGEQFPLLPHRGEGHDGSPPPVECPLLTSLENGTGFRGELDFFRKDGTRFPTATSVTPILESGVVHGAVMIFEDITNRKRQEDDLKASEERFRGLVENATYGIYQSTAAGAFIAVNPALVEMLGYGSAEELLALDMNWDLYADPGERGGLVETFQRAGRVMAPRPPG